MNLLEVEILNLIEKYYKAKYIGGIKVLKLLPVGYKLVLDLGNSDRSALEIATDIDIPEDFLKYIEKELISRLLIKVQWFRGIKTYPEDEQGRNDRKDRSCNC